MKASDHIAQAMEIIEHDSSPYRAELMIQLQHLRWAARMHERCVEARTIPPKETGLGHQTQGRTVLGHQTQTDAALELLDCSD